MRLRILLKSEPRPASAVLLFHEHILVLLPRLLDALRTGKFSFALPLGDPAQARGRSLALTVAASVSFGSHLVAGGAAQTDGAADDRADAERAGRGRLRLLRGGGRGLEGAPRLGSEGALVLWCFALNSHRRSPCSKLLFCITRYAADEFPGSPHPGRPRLLLFFS